MHFTFTTIHFTFTTIHFYGVSPEFQKFPSLRGGRRSLTGWMNFHKFYKRIIPSGFRDAMNFKIPLHRRGVRRTGWFLIPRWQTQSDGVDYVPKTCAPLFSPSPSGNWDGANRNAKCLIVLVYSRF
jgi:hypothetical protein